MVNEDTNTQLRQWLRELISTDPKSNDQDNFDQVSYIVTQALQAGQESVFKDHLKLYIAKKDFDIEKLCSSNYQVRSEAERGL